MRLKMGLVATVALASGCCLFERTAGASAEDEQQRAQEWAERALACSRNLQRGLSFVPRDATIRIRVERGKIPDTSGGLRGPNVYQIFTVTSAETAELREFSLAGKTVIVSGDGYALRYALAGKKWVVVDGNGGAATYEAVGRYVNGMLKRVPERVVSAAAIRRGGECRFPDGKTVRSD